MSHNSSEAKGESQMSGGFTVRETIERSPQEVWGYLTDFGNAKQWMTGVEEMTPLTQGPIEVGSRFRFKARGKERDSYVTAFEPGKRIALTSTQGGVTATYTYSLASAGNSTEVTLNAVCHATGFWKLLHPIIVFAMKRSDASHLAQLKTAITHRG
jgi:uncharacterized protein YndB with AHSA1/START domain